MRFLKPLILTCAATCGVCSVPQFSRAQEAPAFTPQTLLTLDPFAHAMDRPASFAPPTGVAPFSLSLTEPADYHEIDESSLEQPIYACACGCGVFEVGTSSMLPHGQGGMVWLEWDYQNQNRNRKGTHKAPAEDNDDKDLRTDFFNIGVQYFFDRKWGVQVEVPVDHRHFASTDGTFDWTALGDIRIKGLYTGFFEDQSVGIDFGVKLATGNFTHPGPDRDTQIGTGSTDLLFGAFYRTNLTSDHNWNLFTQVECDLPVITQDYYRPGFEADGAVGVYYSGFSFHGVTISPVGQVILSYRSSDGGANSAQPVASGYQRVLLSPGIEFDYHPFSVYADVEIPVFQYFRGDQLAAPALFKVIVSYNF